MSPAVLRRFLLQIVLLGCFACLASGGTILFQDGFETGSLGPAWTVSNTNQGRAIVSKSYSPAVGSYHLILDDSVDDATYSSAQVTLSLDLSHKKNVALIFQAKSLGNEPNYPTTGNLTSTTTFDGVSVSVDGGVTWRNIVSLATVPTGWYTYGATLDSAVAALGGSFNANTLIRFSEYDNSPAPIDGIAIDSITVSADDNYAISVEVPATVTEGTSTYTGHVLLNAPSAQSLSVSLSASVSGQLNLPSTVLVPAGQTSVGFTFSVVDDALVNFSRAVTITAAGTGYTSGSATLTIYDNEPDALSLSIPTQLPEGGFSSNNATLTLDRPGTAALTVLFSSDPSGEVALPASITIPAGETTAAFSIYAVNDIKLDGNVAVTVTATAAGLTPATAQTTTIDDDLRTLAVSFTAATLQEGSTGTGTVTIGGTLTTPLTVNLASSNTNWASVPATVTIPADSTTAHFTITAPDNIFFDGSRMVTITATTDTFPAANAPLTIRDNEAAGYRITGLADIVKVGGPVSVTVAAADIEGNAISGFTGTVNLILQLPDGTVQALNPASVAVSGTAGWTGTVTIPTTSTPGLRLRAYDSAGRTGDSLVFDPMRVISLVPGGLVWDAARSRLYASVSADDTGVHANQVVAINPATAQITGSVTVGNDPGQLQLTSGGEQLYVALDANGNITRITPGTLAINQTFSLGSDPYAGPYHASDFCTVAGQPDVLVVLRAGNSGVAAYENGVARAQAASFPEFFDFIEPSADPTLFLGYEASSSGANLYQLKLDATGVSVVGTSERYFNSAESDIVSSGNDLFATSGFKMSGTTLRRVGTFAVDSAGPACPDPASNRVYFFETNDRYASIEYNEIGVYDANAFAPIRKLSLSEAVAVPYGDGYRTPLVRWGANGLALCGRTAIVLINSNRLVPADAPANLQVRLQAAAMNPADYTAPVVYTVTVTNNGPNLARNTRVAASLSDSQTISALSATAGTPTASGSVVSLAAGDLASGASTTLRITTLAQSAGPLSGTASASSDAADPDPSDNTAYQLISVGFTTVADSMNMLRLNANNLIYDPVHAVLWASVLLPVEAPLSHSVVSIDPLTGIITNIVPLNAAPTANCMALSGNGRYLYVGLDDAPEVARVDLAASSPTVTRVPVGTTSSGEPLHALDIAPLDGDGTSFLLCTTAEDACVYDGDIRRPNRTAPNVVRRLARTGTSGAFIGLDYHSGYTFCTLTVTSAGVACYQPPPIHAYDYAEDVRGEGNLLLTSAGSLINSSTLVTRFTLGIPGRPCLDVSNNRAYLAYGSEVRAFDTTTGLTVGSLFLSGITGNYGALNCVRWGLDGLAVLGYDGKVFIARWSSAIPPSMDSNGNGVSDAWEATWFNSLGVNMFADSDGDGIANALEYLFHTPPTQAAASPVQLTGRTVNASGQAVMRLVFPRRAGLAAGAYGYETSDDLFTWTLNQNVVESVLSSQTVGAVQVDTVQADVTLPTPAHGFVRLRWLYGAAGTGGPGAFSTVASPVSAGLKARR